MGAVLGLPGTSWISAALVGVGSGLALKYGAKQTAAVSVAVGAAMFYVYHFRPLGLPWGFRSMAGMRRISPQPGPAHPVRPVRLLRTPVPGGIRPVESLTTATTPSAWERDWR